MNNYEDSIMNNLEIGIALEDFDYGDDVKISIPSLTPFSDSNNVSKSKNKIIKRNIMNKEIDKLRLTDTESVNYILINVPVELYRHKLNEDNERSATYSGKKGEKFVIMFIGGDIKKPVVLRRY